MTCLFTRVLHSSVLILSLFYFCFCFHAVLYNGFVFWVGHCICMVNNLINKLPTPVLHQLHES